MIELVIESKSPIIRSTLYPLSINVSAAPSQAMIYVELFSIFNGILFFGKSPLATIVTGLIVATLNGYVHQALALGIGSGGGKNTAIGIGMWLGLIMAFNVWFIIWPNQKKALGIVDCTPEEKPICLKKAVMASRINTLLSLPMLLCMVMAQNLY